MRELVLTDVELAGLAKALRGHGPVPESVLEQLDGPPNDDPSPVPSEPSGDESR